MDAQTDMSMLDVDYAPLVGLVAVPAPHEAVTVEPNAPVMPTGSEASAAASLGGSEFERAQRKVLRYLRDKLLQGPSNEVRDRIQTLLYDDEYHRLIVRAEETVPFMAVREMLEDGEIGKTPAVIQAPLVGRYELALQLQFEVVRAIVAAMPTTAERPRKRRVRFRRASRIGATERLAFVYDPSLPSAIKRAILSAWIAPMCCLGLFASDPSTDEQTVAALLDEWIDSMQAQLAFGIALRAVPPLPEEILPLEKRYELSDVVGRHFEGLGRTIRTMGDLERKASTK